MALRHRIKTFELSRTGRPCHGSQKGQAVLITMLLVLGIGIGILTTNATRSVSLQLRADSRTVSALAEAKQALIGRAVADNDRPGSLPCPDVLTDIPGTNVPGDGLADVSVGNDCPSYIGRLPWRTLGLPDLRDDHGERLWYALSPRFRDHASVQPINSDTKGDRLVYAQSTGFALAPQAVALIFAPGAPLGAQLRDTTSAPCAITGTTMPRTLCATHYLDVADGINNASATGPYIAARRSISFNDRVAVLTTADLMPLVEMRVARELYTALIEYRIESACQCYPWAGTTLGVSVPGLNRGRIPSSRAWPEDWGSGNIPLLPAWFQANRWHDVIYYTVGKTALASAGAACTTCIDPLLTLDGIPDYSAIFFTTGPAGASRPSLLWGNYLEDTQNSDNTNDLYVTPASTAMARDRLYALPSASPIQCSANSAMLLQNAPCGLRKAKGQGKKKNTVKPECTLAASNLQVCTCAPQANTLLNKPCDKKLKDKKQCQPAVATLKVCNS